MLASTWTQAAGLAGFVAWLGLVVLAMLYIDADGNPIAVAIAKLLHVPGPTQADPQLHGAGGAAEVIITVGSQTA